LKTSARDRFVAASQRQLGVGLMPIYPAMCILRLAREDTNAEADSWTWSEAAV